MPQSPTPVNTRLYKKIKAEIDARLSSEGKRWSARASQELVNKYKQRGGKYSGPKPTASKRVSPRGEGGLVQWQNEKWTDQYGRPCGSGKKGEVVKCRPSKKVNKTTPVTWKEINSSGKKSKIVNAKKKVGMANRSPSIKRSPTKRSPRGSLSSAPTDFRTKKPLYKPYKSTRSGKKGMVYVMKGDSKRLIHFGDANMSDYTKHHDKDRRKRYLTRSAGITDDQGHLTKNDKNSANYWSRKINW